MMDRFQQQIEISHSRLVSMVGVDKHEINFPRRFKQLRKGIVDKLVNKPDVS